MNLFNFQKIQSRQIFIGCLLLASITASHAQTGLTGSYGCTLKDDKWGKTASVGQDYDNNNLIFTIDFSTNMISGIEIRYKFDASMKITNVRETEYKNVPLVFTSTGINGIFKIVDSDSTLYFTKVNGGKTLLLATSPGVSQIGASGMCQKM